VPAPHVGDDLLDFCDHVEMVHADLRLGQRSVRTALRNSVVTFQASCFMVLNAWQNTSPEYGSEATRK
jgi:hypothetical protein